MAAGFRVTVSCHKREVFTIGGQWFLTEDVWREVEGRTVLLVSRRSPRTLHSTYAKEGVRFEIFPGVFLTVTDAAKRSKVKLRIEAPQGVPISRGYPREVVAPAEPVMS